MGTAIIEQGQRANSHAKNGKKTRLKRQKILNGWNMEAARQTVELANVPAKAKRFVFLLLPNFTLLSFASALECLRIANRMAGKDVYSWTLLSEGGDLVECSAGTTLQT